jgi:membrane-bound lytic murein transglycosylase MltF
MLIKKKHHCIRQNRKNYWLAWLILNQIFLAAFILIGIPGLLAADEKSPVSQYNFFCEEVICDFDEMVQRRKIRVLVVNSKTFYFFDRGQQKGVSHDLLKEFEKFVNKKIKTKTLKMNVVFIPVARDELIPGLLKGIGDIAVANLTITSERLKSVDFSDPLLTNVKEVVVTGPKSPPINSVDDLAGKEIYVRKSSSYYESLVELNKSFKKSGPKAVRLILADENLEDEDLLEMVNAGLIPMIIVDSHKAQFWEQIFDNILVHKDISVRTEGEIAWAFRKNSPKLESVINEFVKGNKKGTLIGNILLTRYLHNGKYVKNAVSKEELKKFTDMVEIFERYANQYGFDYLMITAQAYQESGLDHTRKSHAGAVGIMQLLPSTAADRNVNISDIEDLENNIHAGIKYLRFIVDRYYKNEPMTEGNKLLFAFAAYNAGPAKVNKIRKKTVEIGLDPNIWFNNAEIAAAKIIGRETVQYVSNIYKYFIAYSLVTKKQNQRRQKDKSR